MKDLQAILLQKEREIQRLRHEIEALRSIIPLLTEESQLAGKPAGPGKSALTNKWPLEIPDHYQS